MIDPIKPQEHLQHRNPPDWWASARIQFSTLLGAEIRSIVPRFDERFFEEWGFRWQFLTADQRRDVIAHPLGDEARRFTNRVILELTAPTPWQETQELVCRQSVAACVAFGAAISIGLLAIAWFLKLFFA